MASSLSVVSEPLEAGNGEDVWMGSQGHGRVSGKQLSVQRKASEWLRRDSPGVELRISCLSAVCAGFAS